MANKRKGKKGQGKAVAAMEFNDDKFRMRRAMDVIEEAGQITSDKAFMKKLNAHQKKMSDVLDKAMGS